MAAKKKDKKKYFAYDIPSGGGYTNLYDSLEELVDSEGPDDGTSIFVFEIVETKKLQSKPSLY